ncbi:MAG TPA: hypothetical protein DCM86_15580 [Verrucomicrobiales bacterium]|nr:hypothetical protein [Verrucomicrobiales bacterium]
MSAAPSAGSSFTAAQREAIDARGNVLVVAGAGTGKTRTLVERCLRILLQGGSLERLLLVTFTEAAAAEMRARLRAGIAERAGIEPANQHLQEQLALLETASISTLHGFCRELIQEHFHELGLDPQVIVLDERQTQPLSDAALEGVISSRLRRSEDPARELLSRLGPDPIPAARRLILRLHRHVQSLPDPAGWIRGQRAQFASPDPALWRRELAEAFHGWCGEWLPHLDPLGETPAIARCARALRGALRPDIEPDAIRAALEEVEAADAEWPKGKKVLLRAPVVPFFKEAEALASLVRPGAGDTDPLLEDWTRVRGLMTTLLDLVEAFEAEYTRSKRELGGVDFSDLEQLSLRLLVDPEGRPTPAALGCRRRFDHVFVDEVQDINGAQDAILLAVSRDGDAGNRFLVGDVKQSIYRFRLANPGIFRAYEKSWRSDPSLGRVIPLTDNFRSREGLLAMINGLFEHLMTAGLGGVEYADGAQLRFGNREGRSELATRPGGAVPVELRVLCTEAPALSGEETVEGEGVAAGTPGVADLKSIEREARWVALRLRDLHSRGLEVWDDRLKQLRPVRWGDMVILLRSPGSKVESFAKEFHRAGVPLAAARDGFLAASEITDLLGILRLLDNPLQDIPLLAVLRSPLGCFSLEELAALRTASRRDSLWWGLLALARSGSESPAATKASRFFQLYGAWRERARLGSLSDCLEAILADTHYETLIEVEARGPERLGNVRRLLELARQFDPYQRQGLYRFLRFIEMQEEAELDLPMEGSAATDAVRLMSIHRSKGLEFPVVAVADLGKPFNESDLGEDILLDETLGLAPRVWSGPGGAARYPTPAHWIARRRARLEMVGEELRLLYVALTRARDHLLLVGSSTARKCAAWVSTDEAPEGFPTPAENARGRNVLDWIGAWVRSHAPVSPTPSGAPSGETPLVRWRVGEFRPDEFPPASGSPAVEGSPAPAPPEDREAAERVLQRASWRYGFQASTLEPVKTTVSTLKRRALDQEEEQETSYWPPAGGRRRVAPAGGRSATEVGTLHHIFLQWLDLTRAGSPLDLRNEAARLVESGVLLAADVQELDFEGLAAFWQSEPGRRIREHESSVERELAFTARLSASELRSLGFDRGADATLDPGEFVVVQGQVDLAVIRPEEIWLLDFKTDAVRGAEVDERARQYGVQLRVYAMALERAYRRPVTRRWLHFIAPCRTLQLPA